MSETPVSPASDPHFKLPPVQTCFEPVDLSSPDGITTPTAHRKRNPQRSPQSGDQKSTTQKREDLLELFDILQKRRVQRNAAKKMRAASISSSGGGAAAAATTAGLHNLSSSDNDDGEEDDEDISDNAFEIDIDTSTSSLLMGPLYALGRLVRGAINLLSGSEAESSSCRGGDASANNAKSPFLNGDMAKRMLGFDEARVRKAVELRGKLNKSLARRVADHVSIGHKRVFVGTWNVSSKSPPSPEEVRVWLSGNVLGADPTTGGSNNENTTSNGRRSSSGSSNSNSFSVGTSLYGSSSLSASSLSSLPSTKRRELTPNDIPHVAVIGLQEAAMDGMSLILETTEAVAEWGEVLQSALHLFARECGQPTMFRKLRAVQMVGIIMLIYIPHTEIAQVRNLRTAVTRTGPLSVAGNKGAVGCRFTFYGKRFLFICGHFAPHEHNVSVRDHHFHSALDRLELGVPEGADDLCDFVFRLRSDHSVAGGASGEEAEVRGAGLASRIFQRRDFRKLKNATERSRLLIASHDYTFFFGDLNYRLVRSAEPALIKDLMARERIAQLLQYDELTLGVRKGFIFQGFVEPPVQFQPTYKLRPESEAYDMAKRKPAWTDRILVHSLHGDVDTTTSFKNNNFSMRSHPMNIAPNAAAAAAAAAKGGGNNSNDGNDGSAEDSIVVFLDVDDQRGPQHEGPIESLSNASFGSSNDVTSFAMRRMGSTDSIGSAAASMNGGVTPTFLRQLARRTSLSTGNSPSLTGSGGPANAAAAAAAAATTAATFASSSASSGGAKNDSLSTTTAASAGLAESASQASSPTNSPPALPKPSASLEDFLSTMDSDALINEIVTNKIECQWYCSCPSLRMADHRPVGGTFEVNVPLLAQSAREELMFESRQELGLDLIDEIKYAF